MDEILKKFLEEIQSVDGKKDLSIEFMVLTKTREWFEKIKKEHAQDKECEFPALNLYIEALEKNDAGDTDAAKGAIKNAKEIMDADANDGRTYVKEVFGDLIDELYDKLNP